jgi:hypothetical protein
MKKWILSLLVFLSVLAVTAFIGFYVAIFLVGPHSDILPDWLYIPVGIILLFTILGIPAWLGKKTYVGINRSENKK